MSLTSPLLLNGEFNNTGSDWNNAGSVSSCIASYNSVAMTTVIHKRDALITLHLHYYINNDSITAVQVPY